MPDFRIDIVKIRMHFRTVAGVPGPYWNPTGPWPEGGAWTAGTSAEKMLERLYPGICEAFESWKRSAGFSNITINGAQAHGGKLVGPALGGKIFDRFIYRSQYVRDPRGLPDSIRKNWEEPRAKAIADAIGSAWQEFEKSVRTNGAAWYPMFSAWPKPPLATPTANMPYPLKQLQHDLKCMEGPRLKLSMHQRLQSAWHAHDGPLFEAIAIELDQAACRWINVQLVTEVIGLGPVVAPNTPVMGGTTLLGCHLTT